MSKSCFFGLLEFRNMKVLFVNTYETRGGAAIACKRLAKAVSKAGIDVHLLVRVPFSGIEKNISSVSSNRFKRALNFFRFAWERFTIFLYNRFSRKNLFTVSIANTGTDITRLREVKEADIIHLHWVNQGFLSIKDIEKLSKLNKPVVWTMHDMWPFTGICHYAWHCHGFEKNCGCCPFLTCPSTNDLSTKVFDKKRRWDFSNISFIACSAWLRDCARKATLLEESFVSDIPNPIDTNFWKPQNKNEARRIFGFPENRKLLLFVADNVADSRKGISYLYEALEMLALKKADLIEKMSLIVLGKSSDSIALSSPFHTIPVGYLRDAKQICRLYSAADLFVTPSLEDNLPNTVMEAMACGCPVVGFHIGGIPEMIDHGRNGYVAENRSSADLAKGIEQILFSDDYFLYSTQARLKVEQSYAEPYVSRQYIELYKKLLDNLHG